MMWHVLLIPCGLVVRDPALSPPWPGFDSPHGSYLFSHFCITIERNFLLSYFVHMIGDSFASSGPHPSPSNLQQTGSVRIEWISL